MSRSADLSILGLYTYDNTIFDLLTLPEGLSKDNLIKNILSRLAELEIIYPNPTVLKDLIGVWSVSCQYSWAKLYATMTATYNPIDNYDRTETRTLNSQETGSSQAGGADTVTGSAQNAKAGNILDKAAGFNTGAQALVDKNKTETNENDSLTTNGTTTYGRTNAETFTKADTETIHARGNIGVTTTQQMLTQEREIAAFNIYDIITEDFKQKFCILVY